MPSPFRPGQSPARRPQPKWPEAKTWSSLLDLDMVDVGRVYDRALITLAIMGANEAAELAKQNGTEVPESPDVSDPDELINDVMNGKKPAWWPVTLDRIEITVKARPADAAPTQYGPSPFDPNTGKDVGRKGFCSLTKMLCESIGSPFFGVVEIEIKRKRDRNNIGGTKFEAAIGDAATMAAASNPRGDAEVEWYEKRHRSDTESMQKMFMASASVITASASAINAMRGVNMAPPWMNDQHKEEMPMWMGLAGHAMELLGASGLLTGGNQQAGAAMGRMMGQPMRGGGGPQKMLPMYGGPGEGGGDPRMQQNLGYDEYMKAGSVDPGRGRGVELTSEGEFDGLMADESDLIDNNWNNQGGGNDRGYSGGAPTDGGHAQQSYEDSSGYDGQEGEGYSGGGDGGGASSSGNPLDGKTPEEVATYMEQWLDQGQDKAQVMGLGKRLMKKLF